MCPLPLSTLGSHQSQTCAGPEHALTVSVSSCVHRSCCVLGLLHPLTLLPPHPFTPLPPHPFTPMPLTPSFPHPLTPSPPYPLTPSFPHPLLPSPPRLLIPSPPHSLTPSPPHPLTIPPHLLQDSLNPEGITFYITQHN